MPRRRKPDTPFKRFNSSPEVIRRLVMMYVRFPLGLRNVADLLFESGSTLALTARSVPGIFASLAVAESPFRRNVAARGDIGDAIWTLFYWMGIGSATWHRPSLPAATIQRI